MSELTALSQRIANVEAETKAQSGQLEEVVGILREMKTAFAGNPELGITGIVATAKSAHRRIDEAAKERAIWESEAAKRMTDIEDAAQKERWMGRIGSGVVGATVAAIGMWLKSKLGFGGGE